MPQPYSVDLRWRVVWLCLFHHKSTLEVANLLHVSTKAVERYIECFLRTGNVTPDLRKNGPDRINMYEEMLLIQATSVSVACSTICRTLKKLGFSRQQVCHVRMQQSGKERMQFLAEMVAFEPEMLVWIDEPGFTRRNSLRKFGYGVQGLPPQDFTLKIGGHHCSAIGIMTTDGIEDVYVTEKSVDGEKFMEFVEDTLLPILLPFDGQNSKSVVIMDNTTIRHIEPVVGAINSVGAIVRYLPRYSILLSLFLLRSKHP